MGRKVRDLEVGEMVRVEGEIEDGIFYPEKFFRSTPEGDWYLITVQNLSVKEFKLYQDASRELIEEYLSDVDEEHMTHMKNQDRKYQDWKDEKNGV